MAPKKTLAERMKAQATSAATPTGATAKSAFKGVGPVYEKRLTLDLTADQHRALKMLGAERGLAMADLLRACVDELLQSPALVERLNQRFAGG